VVEQTHAHGYVYSVAFSPDGTRIASAGTDIRMQMNGGIRLWGECLICAFTGSG
jgi:WD40 repeat protein